MLLSVAEVLHSLYSATPVAMATLVGTRVCFVLQFNWPNFVNTVWYAGLLVVHCLVESVLAVLLARTGKCAKLSLMRTVMSYSWLKLSSLYGVYVLVVSASTGMGHELGIPMAGLQTCVCVRVLCTKLNHAPLACSLPTFKDMYVLFDHGTDRGTALIVQLAQYISNIFRTLSYVSLMTFEGVTTVHVQSRLC